MEAAGIQSFLMNMYRNLDREKVQFDFLVHYKEKQFFDDEIERLGGKVYRLSVREDYNIIKYYIQLSNFFKKHKEYKIIHGHMDSLGAIYLKCANKAGVTIRIAHAHNDSIQNGIKRIFRLFMISKYKKYANLLFACSQNAGKFMFYNSKFLVWNNAIDTKRFFFNEKVRKEKRKELGINGQVVFGNVGRLHIQKNQLFLLDILGEMVKIKDNVILVLIGSGELKQEICEKIKTLNLDKYVMLLSDRHDVNELYQAMDAFVLPSLYEGLPVSGIEAQASGLPCFFSDTITRSADITENVVFYSLDRNAKEWANKLLDVTMRFKRKDVTDSIVKNGYDAQCEAIKLQKEYQYLYENVIRIQDMNIQP